MKNIFLFFSIFFLLLGTTCAQGSLSGNLGLPGSDYQASSPQDLNENLPLPPVPTGWNTDNNVQDDGSSNQDSQGSSQSQSSTTPQSSAASSASSTSSTSGSSSSGLTGSSSKTTSGSEETEQKTTAKTSTKDSTSSAKPPSKDFQSTQTKISDSKKPTDSTIQPEKDSQEQDSNQHPQTSILIPVLLVGSVFLAIAAFGAAITFYVIKFRSK